MSEPITFTDEEKRLISLYSQDLGTWRDQAMHYGSVVVPSILFALYGLWHKDFVATLVAYGALLIAALAYLSYSRKYTAMLRSVLKKYEALRGQARQ